MTCRKISLALALGVLLLSPLAVFASVKAKLLGTSPQLLAEPSLACPVRLAVPTGEEVEVLSLAQGWCLVQLGTNTGYVPEESLAFPATSLALSSAYKLPPESWKGQLTEPPVFSPRGDYAWFVGLKDEKEPARNLYSLLYGFELASGQVEELTTFALTEAQITAAARISKEALPSLMIQRLALSPEGLQLAVERYQDLPKASTSSVLVLSQSGLELESLEQPGLTAPVFLMEELVACLERNTEGPDALRLHWVARAADDTVYPLEDAATRRYLALAPSPEGRRLALLRSPLTGSQPKLELALLTFTEGQPDFKVLAILPGMKAPYALRWLDETHIGLTCIEAARSQAMAVVVDLEDPDNPTSYWDLGDWATWLPHGTGFLTLNKGDLYLRELTSTDQIRLTTTGNVDDIKGSGPLVALSPTGRELLVSREGRLWLLRLTPKLN